MINKERLKKLKLIVSDLDGTLLNGFNEIGIESQKLIKALIKKGMRFTFATGRLHSAVVEIIVKKDAKVKYYTVQNWSKNVYNLVTKRALAKENAVVEWIDGNIGSGITMKYPAVILQGEGSKAEVCSLAVASGEGQIQDSGAKAIHNAKNTSSRIISKSISRDGGRASFRGCVIVKNGASNCKSFIQCDSLLMDEYSQADAYPYLDVSEKDVDVGHEARISKIEDEYDRNQQRNRIHKPTSMY